jgi:hypothetical protein
MNTGLERVLRRDIRLADEVGTIAALIEVASRANVAA